jgi:hypothetical protein
MQAIRFLLDSTNADRVGVWMESTETEQVLGRRFVGFRGMVADRDGEATPSEWERLSPEPPLPVELLHAGKSVEQDLGDAPDQTILGALLEIRRVVWVPVGSAGRLRGVLFAGLRKKHGVLPVQLLESVSAELALAVELDDERRRARQQQADISVTNWFLEELASAGPSDAALARLVESCTDTGTEGDGLGAAFAVLRARDEATGISSPAPRARLIAKRVSAPESVSDISAPIQPQANQRRALSWQSGDAAWLQSLDSQYLEGIWQQRLETIAALAVRLRETVHRLSQDWESRNRMPQRSAQSPVAH